MNPSSRTAHCRRPFLTMKIDDQNDEKLSAALRTWKVSEPLPPRFQEQVWSRIERAEASRGVWLTSVIIFVERLFARPALAYAYALLLLTLGLTGGYLTAQQQEFKMETQLAARYVQSIDPYQKSGH